MNNWTRPNKPELDAIKVPSEITIAWAAGIYEGEGTCRLCGKTKRGFMASIAQKDPELLYWLRDYFGGNVRGPSKTGGHNLEICGDRARIFIALIYGFMTARRKSQIQATGALDFLEGKAPEGMSIEQLKAELKAYYEVHSRRNVQLGQLKKNGLYAELLNDPEEVEKLLRRTTRFSKNMTPEEKESYAKVQHERYLRRKGKLRALSKK